MRINLTYMSGMDYEQHITDVKIKSHVNLNNTGTITIVNPTRTRLRLAQLKEREIHKLIQELQNLQFKLRMEK